MLRKMLMGALLLIALAASPAAAQYDTVGVSPGTVTPGGTVTLTGQACLPNVEVTILLVPGAAKTKSTKVTTVPPEGVQVAAAAWNHAYTASCFDDYVAQFAAEHYGQGPENLCGDGANMGGTPIEP